MTGPAPFAERDAVLVGDPGDVRSGGADTRLMDDARGMRENQRIWGEFKSDNVLVKPIRRFAVPAVDQYSPAAE